MVADFLTRFHRIANILEMSKGQALIAFSFFLKGIAKSQDEAGAEIVSPDDGGVSSWLEFVKNFLRNYVQLSRISSGIGDLQTESQGFMKMEWDLEINFNQAICCWKAFTIRRRYSLCTPTLCIPQSAR